MKQLYNNRILVITDTHFPYQDDRMWDFLAEVRANFRPDRVVHCGDICDNYNHSRYPKDPDHPDSWVNEQGKVRVCTRRLGELFPLMDVMVGNHDERYFRNAVSSGIPTSLLVGLPEVIGAPEGWKFHDDLTLTVQATKEEILFCHNRGANTFLIAQRLGKSFVAGHQHSKGHVTGYNNGERTYFGVNVPCLISNSGAPFSYTKLSNINPVRGCVLIKGGVPNMVLLR